MAEPARDFASQPAASTTHLRTVQDGRTTDRVHVHDGHPDEIHYPIPEAFNLTHDRVRWGPIFAGFVTALTSLVLLGMLGVAIGMTSVDAFGNAAQGTTPPDVGRNTAIWGGISSIIAFLIGGYVAGRTSAVFDRGWGTLNGMLVFLFAVPVMLWLAGQGLGAIMGTMGSFDSGLQVDPGTAQSAANQAAQTAGQASATISPTDVSRAAETARNAAWAGLLGSLLALGAAALGGAMGTRREVRYEGTTGAVHE
jgi:hypothetical protein